MATLSPHFIDLVYDTLLKSFWTKKRLREFLRRSGVPESDLLPRSEDESKRDILDRVFPTLEVGQKGPALINRMARFLAEQTKFPDLENWENAQHKIEAAKRAVAALKDYISKHEREKQSAVEREVIRKKAAEARERATRSEAARVQLNEQLTNLFLELGTSAGGIKFQDWFYDLMNFCEVINRRPYWTSGRQIDGSVTIDGTTYLVELKFTKTQSDATDIDSLFKKVNTKADNTMGILVSMSGYSSVAVEEASGQKSPLLLLDHSHLYMVLQGIEGFADVVRRVRRHSSQTGQAYLATTDFGGAA